MARNRPTAAYVQHADDLQGLLRALADGGGTALREATGSFLGQRAADDLRELVSLKYRRSVGAFFTTGELRDRITEVVSTLPGRTVIDPTCGAGDLLLASVDRLPVFPSLAETIQIWEERIYGFDLHSEFVNAARSRLVLAAIAKTMDAGLTPVFDLQESREPFANSITTADFLESHSTDRKFDIVVFNPPYTKMPSPKGCTWSSGSTSSAAVFFLQALQQVSDGGHIVAILPDSLRSGSLYEKWRNLVSEKANVLQVERLGIFDQYADIDVFLLVAQVGGAKEVTSPPWWNLSELVPAGAAPLSNFFDIRVGTVVDNRDPFEGRDYPFLVARDLPSDGSIGAPTRRRQFNGRVFAPPFVVIRRTSRPSTPGVSRANGVLVTGRRKIAVDNHLLVATPLQGGIDKCQDLLKVLEDPRISLILDERISCRHLTVSSVKDLPWLL